MRFTRGALAIFLATTAAIPQGGILAPGTAADILGGGFGPQRPPADGPSDAGIAASNGPPAPPVDPGQTGSAGEPAGVPQMPNGGDPAAVGPSASPMMMPDAAGTNPSMPAQMPQNPAANMPNAPAQAPPSPAAATGTVCAADIDRLASGIQANVLVQQGEAFSVQQLQGMMQAAATGPVDMAQFMALKGQLLSYVTAGVGLRENNQAIAQPGNAALGGLAKASYLLHSAPRRVWG